MAGNHQGSGSFGFLFACLQEISHFSGGSQQLSSRFQLQTPGGADPFDGSSPRF